MSRQYFMRQTESGNRRDSGVLRVTDGSEAMVYSGCVRTGIAAIEHREPLVEEHHRIR